MLTRTWFKLSVHMLAQVMMHIRVETLCGLSEELEEIVYKSGTPHFARVSPASTEKFRLLTKRLHTTLTLGILAALPGSIWLKKVCEYILVLLEEGTSIADAFAVQFLWRSVRGCQYNPLSYREVQLYKDKSIDAAFPPVFCSVWQKLRDWMLV